MTINVIFPFRIKQRNEAITRERMQKSLAREELVRQNQVSMHLCRGNNIHHVSTFTTRIIYYYTPFIVLHVVHR